MDGESAEINKVENNVEYAPGMRVLIRGEEWMVKKVEINNLENKVLHCVGVTPLVKNNDVVFLTDIEEIEVVDPARIKLVSDDSPHFRKSLLYIESQWRQKTPTDSALYLGDKAAMDLMRYQLIPAQKSLQRPRQRILIADAVGLGKTLEAGILMSELILRGKGKRILVVTVKSMMTQFQKEMWNRFTIPLVRLDSKKIHDIRAKLPSNHNPFFYYDKAIISVDTLKRDVEYRTHLENAYWDIIVIDEAQNVAERGDRQAQRSRLAQLLANRSDTMIMLSATPHDGRAKSFASLMNMLDPTAIANPEDYRKEDIKGLCIRRFKKDIQGQNQNMFLERRFQFQRCDASELEEEAFDIFSEMRLQMDQNRVQQASMLFKTSLEKALFSSPAACIKSIDVRLTKLRKKYPDNTMDDIQKLEELRGALDKIKPEHFSRYQQLLFLLNSKEYGWTRGKNDRLVIFTERIETMKYLAEHLRKDLKLNKEAVQEISGSMSDVDQQKIVEDFGREEASVRVLVASDVASEGLNLHYCCHRLIHFDIPWSLMVFQQRNGRIDRYGQSQRPDIRYMQINSKNESINGDVRILEILTKKEENALKNIGDPAFLLGKFSVEEEEITVAQAMESGSDAEEFEKQLDQTYKKEFDPIEFMMAEEPEENNPEEVKTETTFYRDKDYLCKAMEYLHCEVTPLDNVSGLRIRVPLNSDIRRRLKAQIPEEAMPEGEYLQLSDDKQFCMGEMKRSMQNIMSENAWPKTQYLWKLHPVFSWVNDKAGLFFGRNEAPVLVVPKGLAADEFIYIVSGSIPNRKSVPLVDEWFGVGYRNGVFSDYPMDQLVQRTQLGRDDIPNIGQIPNTILQEASFHLSGVVEYAKQYLKKLFDDYQQRMNPLLDEEINKLASLEKKHKAYQLELFENERQRSEKEREIDTLFNKFTTWVEDTLTIQNTPYIRIIAVLKGAAQ